MNFRSGTTADLRRQGLQEQRIMHGLQQALLPLVLAIRKDCLKNESVNGAPQGDAYRIWITGTVQCW